MPRRFVIWLWHPFMIQAKPAIVELDMDKLEEILRRLDAKQLDADDYETIKAVIGVLRASLPPGGRQGDHDPPVAADAFRGEDREALGSGRWSEGRGEWVHVAGVRARAGIAHRRGRFCAHWVSLSILVPVEWTLADNQERVDHARPDAAASRNSVNHAYPLMVSWRHFNHGADFGDGCEQVRMSPEALLQHCMHSSLNLLTLGVLLSPQAGRPVRRDVQGFSVRDVLRSFARYCHTLCGTGTGGVAWQKR